MLQLSIIIPCYNAGLFLPETIASLQAYSGQHRYEVIVVNDGSTDGATLTYLHTLEHLENFRVIHQPNAGPAAARNTGVRAARGGYVLFVDSDNTLLGNAFINRGMTVMEEEPQVGVFYGNPAFFGAVTDDRIFTTGAFDLQTMLSYNYIDMCSLVRKTAWQQVGGLDENRLIAGHEDWDFWLRIGRAGWQFHYEQQTLFNYRIVANSLVTQSTSSAHYDRMVGYILQKHHAILPQHLKDWCASLPTPDGPVPNTPPFGR